MALQAKYQQYLARPSADALADDAAIHYIPSTTSIKEPKAILKHVSMQSQLVKRKEHFLNVIEGQNSICVETETTLHFAESGGAYLPGLDDNFLADKTVTLPITHIVSFDDDERIQQIRLLWDQGCLLKSIDIIGNRGNSWPIRSGKDQITALTTSIDASDGSATNGDSHNDDRQGRRASRLIGGANADKYRSLHLFAPREHAREDSPGNAVAPVKSAKPDPRDYHDLFAAGAGLPKDDRPTSPTKERPVKAGSGKHHQENRLFDDAPAEPSAPERSIKTNPAKYQHFEFGDPEPQASPQRKVNTKHNSQWDFADFTTPNKARQKSLAHHERHFGIGDGEEDVNRPVERRPNNPHPRPDAATHFEFSDDSAAMPPPAERPRSRRQEETTVRSEDNDTAGTKEKLPLRNITNSNTQSAKGHRKNFSSQFEIKDQSPDSKPKRSEGINIQGDGMGSRKTGEKGWWEYE